MARKKNIKERPEESYWKPVFNDESAFRLMKLVEQTGLSPSDLVQKWILQEETLVALIQQGNKPNVASTQSETPSTVSKQKKTVAKSKRGVASKSSTSNYPEKLVKRVHELTGGGMSLKDIAKTFNDEKVPTISGATKWYTNSVSKLLR